MPELERLIPARAGNTESLEASSASHEAHPRSHGEHSSGLSSSGCSGGSSPLARGTRILLVTLLRYRRLIPARAGNTVVLLSARIVLPAHPRSRGEHIMVDASVSHRRGSSPLARGTLRESVKHRARERLIPARAGNTRPGVTREPSCPAHPRSRGEHWWMLWLWWSRSGSSPLARGTRQRQSHVPGHVRLIPARAGNTYFPPFRARAGTAHPRSRGEHSLVIMCQPAMFGSSPLARGTLLLVV